MGAAQEAAKQKAQQMINDNSVVVFSKSYCPYCRSTKRTLEGLGAKYAHYELDEEADGSTLQDVLEQLTGQRSVPNIFIGKEHIGGNSDLEARKRTDLEKLLRESGAITA